MTNFRLRLPLYRVNSNNTLLPTNTFDLILVADILRLNHIDKL